jgi:hypothetical protein
MDYNNIQQQANHLQTGADSMRKVAQAMKQIADSLQKANWFGQFTVLIMHFQGISDAANNLAQVEEFLSKGLLQAMQDHKNGDAEIKGYFNLQSV